MFCAIWYHWYNFKNVKKTQGGVLLLVKLLLQGCLSRFLNCANGTKLSNASQMIDSIVSSRVSAPPWNIDLTPFLPSPLPEKNLNLSDHLYYMVAASPNFRGDLKISDQNNSGGPSKKLSLEGELHLRGDLNF